MHAGQADQAQEIIDDAKVVGEKIAPDDRDEGGGDDHRQEESQPEEVEQPSRHRAVERHRQQQTDRDVEGDRKQREAQRVPENLQRARIGEEAREIVEADPARAEHGIVVAEAQDEGEDDRRQHEGEIEQRGRQHEQICRSAPGRGPDRKLAASLSSSPRKSPACSGAKKSAPCPSPFGWVKETGVGREETRYQPPIAILGGRKTRPVRRRPACSRRRSTPRPPSWRCSSG